MRFAADLHGFGGRIDIEDNQVVNGEADALDDTDFSDKSQRERPKYQKQLQQRHRRLRFKQVEVAICSRRALELIHCFALATLILSPLIFSQLEARETINSSSQQVFIDTNRQVTINGSTANSSHRLRAPQQQQGGAPSNKTLAADQAPFNSLQIKAIPNQQVPQVTSGVASSSRQQQLKTETSSTTSSDSGGGGSVRRSSEANSSPTSNRYQQQQPRLGSNASLALVRQRWRQLERSVGDSMSLIGGQLKATLDELLGKQSTSGVSANCKLALAQLFEALGEQTLWASQTLDASAKLPSGLLEGTLTELGHFDQCMAIRYPAQVGPASRESTKVNLGGANSSSGGQYCSIQVRPPLMPRPRLHTVCQPMPALSLASNQTNIGGGGGQALRLLSQQSHQFYYVGLRLGVCTPSQCARSDLQQLLTAYLAKYELLGQVKSCQSAPDERESGLDFVQQCVASAFVALLVLVALGTLLDSSSPSSLGTMGRSQGDVPFGSSFWSSSSSSAVNNIGGNQRHSSQAAAGGAKKRRKPTIQGRRWSQFHVYQAANELTGSQTEAGQLQRNPLLELAALAAGGTGQRKAAEDEEAWVSRLEANQREVFLEAARSNCHLERDLGLPKADRRAAAAREHETRPAGQARLEARGSSRSRTVLKSLLVCFSIKRNLANVGRHTRGASGKATSPPMRQDSEMGDIRVIHGLRTITMVWIIFGHTIGLVSPEMMNSLFSLAQLSCSSRLLQAILNATLAVNTFFMISGLVTVISFGRKCRSARRLLPSAAATAKAATTATREANFGAKRNSEAELWSMDSSSVISSSLDSSASSNRCIGPTVGAERSQQGQQDRSKRQQMLATSNQRNSRQEQKQEQQQQNSEDWPSDFKPLLWLAMRYLRLTPAYAAILGFSILLPALGSGPFWLETAGSLGPACRQNWWLNLLYVNNFIGTDKLCLIHSWYLSNDWQFFALSLLLFGVFYKSRKLACLLLISLLTASTAATFALTVTNELPPTIVTTSPAIAERWLFIHSLYYKPWPHLPSYLVGLLVGYLLLIRDRIRLGSSWRLFGWLMSTLIALTLLNSIYPWNMGLQVDPLLTGLHSSTFRTLWSACCAFLVFGLATRPQNPLARLLSWHGFQVTSRLTYCAYLVHPLIIYYHFGSLRERIDSSLYGQLHRFMATLGLSYLFSLLLSLLVEGPSVELHRFLVELSATTSGCCSSNSHNEDCACPRAKEQPKGGDNSKRARQCSTVHSWTASSSFGEQSNSLVESPHSFKVTSTLVGGSGEFSFNRQQPRHLQEQPTPNLAAAKLAQVLLGPPGTSADKAASTSSASCNNLLAGKSDELDLLTAAGQQHQSLRANAIIMSGGGGNGCSSPPALDADFQRKLAQAISRGFRIRSRIANGTINSRKHQQLTTIGNAPVAANKGGGAQRRAGHEKRLPQELATTTADGRHLSAATLGGARASRPTGEFSTFLASPPRGAAIDNKQQHSTATSLASGRRRQSHYDLTATTNGATTQLQAHSHNQQQHRLQAQHHHLHLLDHNLQQRHSSSPAAQTPVAASYLSSAANLNELILMKQKLLSRSQSQTDVKQ